MCKMSYEADEAYQQVSIDDLVKREIQDRDLRARMDKRRANGEALQALTEPKEVPQQKKAAPAISLEEVIAFRKAMFESSLALVSKKGADYNRDQQTTGDTLFNLRVAEILGITQSTEEGILVRLSDKLMRLISLTKPGRDAEVKDESVLDTIRDVHNYSDYLGIIWQSRRRG